MPLVVEIPAATDATWGVLGLLLLPMDIDATVDAE